MKTEKINVPSIHCEHCVHTIKMELSEMEGVKGVSVDLEEKTVTVSYDTPATKESIKDLLIQINYPAE